MVTRVSKRPLSKDAFYFLGGDFLWIIKTRYLWGKQNLKCEGI